MKPATIAFTPFSSRWFVTALVAVTVQGCALSHTPVGGDDVVSTDVIPADGFDVVSERADARPDGDAQLDGDVADVRFDGDAPDGRDAMMCSDGAVSCNGSCTDTRTDPRNCGTCGTDCTALPGVRGTIQCAGGVCQVASACNVGFGDCDNAPGNGCEVNVNTRDHCGNCTTVCNAAAPNCSDVGDGGVSFACTTGCGGTTPDLCPSGCVDLQTDLNHCGMCTTDCASGTAPMNTVRGCSAGACTLTCVSGFGNCDTSPGCEVDLTSSLTHCGNCNTVCMAGANETPSCTNGTCAKTCNANFGDCDGNATNGCEADLRTTTAHCGTCATACTSAPANGTAVCVNSVCDFTCMSPKVRSGSSCVDPQNVCPGVTLSISPGVHTTLTGTTAGAGADLTGQAAGGHDCSMTGGAPDVVYQIMPPATGQLTVQLTAPGFDGVLYARSTCDTASTQVGCIDANASGVQETLTISVTQNTPVFIVVDGNGTGGGAFGLDLLLSATCGDHTLDASENCDDGNARASDGCDNNCQASAPIFDTCNNGNTAILVDPGQQVYTGTITSGTADDQHCMSQSSSNGHDLIYRLLPSVDGTLRIDYAPTNTSWDAVLYTSGGCGTNSATCIDVNSGGGTETATVNVTRNSQLFVIADTHSMTDFGTFNLTFNLSVCGNGTLEAGEECDDGGTANGDGCDNTCRIEASCKFMDNGTNTFVLPQTLTATCHGALVTGSLGLATDNDFYKMTLTQGARVRVRTYQTTLGTDCPTSFDPLVEVYFGAATLPTNNTCAGSTAIVCQDDASATNACQDLTFVAPTAGDYLFRVISASNAQTLSNYKLLIQY